MRRLEGEAIRDAMLTVSGRLDPRMYGPSVPVHLTAFQDGRGRPASGPLDGDGRRSLYLSVRRNFLSPFLLAFDTPIPFSDGRPPHCVQRAGPGADPAERSVRPSAGAAVGQARACSARLGSRTNHSHV